MNRHSLQGDAAMTGILERMGARVEWNGDVVAALPGKELRAADTDVRDIPDLAPPLAALCCFARGTSRITGAQRLRLKESDRLNALATELRRLGADIRQGPGSLTITGRARLKGGAADAHGDHRIAMALAVAAIRCETPVALTGWEHVGKSYPAFWDDFEKGAADG
jgi:3-phosphoshikimate 1-carboxyvinyltransferase